MNPSGSWPKALIILFFALTIFAVLSKERAAMFFLLLPVFDISFLKKDDESYNEYFSDKKRQLIWIGLFAVFVIYIILRLTIFNFGNTFNFYKTQNIYSSNLLVRIYTFFPVFLEYCKLIFFPFPLYMERSPIVYTDFFYLPVLIGAAFFTILTIFSVKSFFQKRILFFVFFWFIIALAPTSGAVPVNAIMMEHWLYFSMAGPVILLGKILAQNYNSENFKGSTTEEKFEFNNRRKTYFFLAAAPVVFFAILTVRQNKVWKNPKVFYEHILKYNPNSVKAHNNIAMVYSDEKNIGKAVAHYKKSIELDNSFPQPHHNLARLYLEQNNINDALAEYNKALEIDKDFIFSHVDLAEIYSHFKDSQKVEFHRKRIEEIKGGIR